MDKIKQESEKDFLLENLDIIEPVLVDNRLVFPLNFVGFNCLQNFLIRQISVSVKNLMTCLPYL
jgi:hypothetical protein